MLISRLMTGLHNYTRRWGIQADRNQELYSFAMLSPVQTFESNILYFGFVSQLPFVLPKNPVSFLCIEDAPLPSVCTSPSAPFFNLILLDKDTSQIEILRTLTNLFAEDAFISNCRSRLIDVLHSNRGLQAIIDCAYDILHNSIITVDSSYKVLAMCLDVSAVERKDLEEQRSLGYMLQENIDTMIHDRIYEQIRTKGGPLYFKNKEAEHGWIHALIYIHGIEVGQLGVMEGQHSFTDADYIIIEFLCKIISLELQKSDFYRTNQGLMHSYFLSELLDNQFHDSSVLEQRMASLNWNLTSNLYIMLITDSGRNFFDGKAQLITQQLHHILPSSRWVIYHGQIIFLLSAESAGNFRNHKKLSSYLEINHLTATFSNRFDSLLDIRKYYLQAVKAYDFGSHFHPEDPIHLYTDYMFYHMGQIISEQYDLKDFYHAGIIAIRDYDRNHQTDFLETLRLYLLYIDQPAIVAEKLFVHKNTVFYRINKLKEQFHLNLSDGDERFKIQMTLRLMELE